MKQAGRRGFGVEGPRVLTGYIIAVAGTVVVTGGLLALRGRVTATNVALAYLLVVVAAAANGGLWPGVTGAGLGFLAFDLLFLPPYGHIKVHNQQDYVSLAVYLLIALVVSVLVDARERRRAQAERREHETRTLYELSNSLLGHDSLQDTLQRVAATVRSLFDLAGCAIVLPSDSTAGVVVAASDGRIPEQLPAMLDAFPDGEIRLRQAFPGDAGSASTLMVAMRTAQRPVGAMVVIATGRQPSGFGEVERRLLTTFAN
jgi:two-component system sensor histidine kinase KdpD